MKTYTYKDTLHSCYLSFIIQAIINNLAPLFFVIFQEQYDISFTMIGTLISMNFGIQIITNFITSNVVDKVGFRKCAAVAHTLCIIGLIGLGVFPQIFPSPYIGLLVAIAINGIGGGIIDVFVNPTIQALPGDAKDSAMSLLHSFYCWGSMIVIIITTIVLQFIGHENWYFIPIAWSILPIYNLFKFMKVPLAPPVPAEEKLSMKDLFSNKSFWLMLVLMICAGSAELNMSQWSSTFVEKALNLPKFLGDLLGPSLFAAAMGVGRAYYGVNGHKLDLKKAMTFCSVLCAISYVVTAVSNVPVISLISLALCGLAVSILWPGTFSLAGELFPNGGGLMFGLMAMFGNLGGTIGPSIIGYISTAAQKLPSLVDYGQSLQLSLEQIGLKAGLLTSVVFPIIFFITIKVIRSRKQQAQN